ncbi:uncharacterized protein V2V93DRAFT_370603 [Kockiozyma suomiensis]|uniref:uncharacterized protein n=1 Tax=Kockiozyma suomiensis TaxID=1337062 RepID=UPI0033433D98
MMLSNIHPPNTYNAATIYDPPSNLNEFQRPCIANPGALRTAVGPISRPHQTIGSLATTSTEHGVSRQIEQRVSSSTFNWHDNSQEKMKIVRLMSFSWYYSNQRFPFENRGFENTSPYPPIRPERHYSPVRNGEQNGMLAGSGAGFYNEMNVPKRYVPEELVPVMPLVMNSDSLINQLYICGELHNNSCTPPSLTESLSGEGSPDSNTCATFNAEPALSEVEKETFAQQFSFIVENNHGVSHRFSQYQSPGCYGNTTCKFHYMAPKSTVPSFLGKMSLITDYDPHVLLVVIGEPDWELLVTSSVYQRRKVMLLYDGEMFNVKSVLSALHNALGSVFLPNVRAHIFGEYGSGKSPNRTAARDALSPSVVTIVQFTKTADSGVYMNDFLSVMNLYSYANDSYDCVVSDNDRILSTDFNTTGFIYQPADPGPNAIVRVLSNAVENPGSVSFFVEVVCGVLSHKVQFVFQAREFQKRHIARQFWIDTIRNMEGDIVRSLNVGEPGQITIRDTRFEYTAEHLNAMPQLFMLDLNSVIAVTGARTCKREIDPDRIIIQVNLRNYFREDFREYFRLIPIKTNTEVILMADAKRWHAQVASIEDPDHNGFVLVHFLLFRNPSPARAADFVGAPEHSYMPWVGSPVSIRSYESNYNLWFKGVVFETIT